MMGVQTESKMYLSALPALQLHLAVPAVPLLQVKVHVVSARQHLSLRPAYLLRISVSHVQCPSSCW